MIGQNYRIFYYIVIIEKTFTVFMTLRVVRVRTVFGMNCRATMKENKSETAM